MKDINGRAYATVDATAPGDMLQADGGFIDVGENDEEHVCIPEGAVLQVKADAEGLFVDCSHGQHYLAGQVETDGGSSPEYYMGLYPAR